MSVDEGAQWWWIMRVSKGWPKGFEGGSGEPPFTPPSRRWYHGPRAPRWRWGGRNDDAKPRRRRWNARIRERHTFFSLFLFLSLSLFLSLRCMHSTVCISRRKRGSIKSSEGVSPLVTGERKNPPPPPASCPWWVSARALIRESEREGGGGESKHRRRWISTSGEARKSEISVR